MVRFGWMLWLFAACSAPPPRSQREAPRERASEAAALRFVDRARGAMEANRLVATLVVINDRIDQAYVPPPLVNPRKRLAELEAQRRELLERIRVVRANREVLLKTPRGPGGVRISRACLVNPLAKDCD